MNQFAFLGYLTPVTIELQKEKEESQRDTWNDDKIFLTKKDKTLIIILAHER